jgi:choline dehydrogenase-like flavoprotein
LCVAVGVAGLAGCDSTSDPTPLAQHPQFAAARVKAETTRYLITFTGRVPSGFEARVKALGGKVSLKDDVLGFAAVRGLDAQEAQSLVRDRLAATAEIEPVLRLSPVPENRVQPAWDQLDAIGIPRPRLTYRYDEHTLAGLSAARDVADRIFKAMESVYIHHGEEPFGAGHVMGTHRMGSDPKTSVVNAEQRSHDHPNLFLLGAGVFPTVGTANPTLTISALALWAADTIRKDLASGGLGAG